MRLVLCFVLLISLFFSGCEPGEPDAVPELLDFAFADLKVVSVKINHEEKSVVVIVPYRTSLKQLRASLLAAQGVEIIPASGSLRDFSVPVYYTLSKGKSKVVYTISVRTEEQPFPSLASVDRDSVEAGTGFLLSGRNFGSFQPEISAWLHNGSAEMTKLSVRLLDSTRLMLTVPVATSPGSYRVKVTVDQKTVESDFRLFVSYPAPVLVALTGEHLLQGDTLWVKGEFLDAGKYSFQAHLYGTSGKYISPLSVVRSGNPGFLVTPETPPGKYEVRVFNRTEGKESREKAPAVIYHKDLPFVTGIENAREAYIAPAVIRFKTLNFERSGARFYQTELYRDGFSYVQNALPDAASPVLPVEIPAQLPPGEYRIRFFLSNPESGYSYAFSIDQRVVVKTQ